MTRISFVLGLLILAIAAVYIRGHQTTYPCDQLSCIGLPSSAHYTLQETYIRTPTLYRALYKSDSEYLRIETQRVAKKDANASLLAAVSQMKAMYEKAPAPYPGDISDSVVCDPEFIPSYKELERPSGRLSVFTGFLNNRMTFGSCSKSQAVYKGFLVYMYCPQSEQFIRTELIYPVSEFTQKEAEAEKNLQTLSCGAPH